MARLHSERFGCYPEHLLLSAVIAGCQRSVRLPGPVGGALGRCRWMEDRFGPSPSQSSGAAREPNFPDHECSERGNGIHVKRPGVAIRLRRQASEAFAHRLTGAQCSSWRWKRRGTLAPELRGEGFRGVFFASDRPIAAVQCPWVGCSMERLQRLGGPVPRESSLIRNCTRAWNRPPTRSHGPAENRPTIHGIASSYDVAG